MAAALQDGGRVTRDKPPGFAPGEQGFQADAVAVDGGLGSRGATRANTDGVCGHEAGQGGRADGCDVGRSDELGERGQVPSICRHGMGRAAVGLKVLQELLYGFWRRHGALLVLCPWIVVVVDTGVSGGLYQVISDTVSIDYGDSPANVRLEVWM